MSLLSKNEAVAGHPLNQKQNTGGSGLNAAAMAVHQWVIFC